LFLNRALGTTQGEKSVKINYSLLFIIITSFLLFVTGCTGESNATYTVNKAAITQPDAKITTVTNNEDETILTIEYINTGKREARIGIDPPGHDMAFFITDIKSSEKYSLLDSDGVAIIPNRNSVNPGESLTFKLIFERIKMDRFHLVEGKLPTKNAITWHFTNIKLK
jgi:hypothetical protein